MFSLFRSDGLPGGSPLCGSLAKERPIQCLQRGRLIGRCCTRVKTVTSSGELGRRLPSDRACQVRGDPTPKLGIPVVVPGITGTTVGARLGVWACSVTVVVWLGVWGVVGVFRVRLEPILPFPQRRRPDVVQRSRVPDQKRLNSQSRQSCEGKFS